MVVNIRHLFQRILFLGLCFFAGSLQLFADSGLSGLADSALSGAHNSDDTWVDPVDTTEEDLVIPSLQLVNNENKTVDPKFVAFLADISGRLALPQTYQSALSDLLISLRNDQIWKADATMRRAMLNLLHRAEVYGRRNGGKDLESVDQMVKEAFELWPPGPDRPRIIGLMNSVAAFKERQAAAVLAAQEKTIKEALKEADRLQKEKEKVEKDAAAAAKEAARAAEIHKAKTVRVSRERIAKPKVPTAGSVVQGIVAPGGAAATPEDVDAIVPTRRPRLRKKPGVGDVVAVSDSVVVQAPESAAPERFDYLPKVINSSEQTVNSDDANVAPVSDQVGEVAP